jgi:hypothetical protein
MFRSKAPEAESTSQASTNRRQEIEFRVGERVETTTPASGLSAGRTGEVTGELSHRSEHGDETAYEVTLDEGSWKITATGHELKRIAPYDPHSFEVGTRVRLLEDFDGFLWDEDIAAEMTDGEPRGEQVQYKAGAVGTVVMHPPGEEVYMVQLDRQRMTLAVRFSKLERIRGRTRIITEPDGGVRIQQLFGYLDVVRLREDIPLQDGTTLKKGSVGGIRPMSAQATTSQLMEECWRTGNYTIFVGNPSGPLYEVPSGMLQLDSDFR